MRAVGGQRHFHLGQRCGPDDDLARHHLGVWGRHLGNLDAQVIARPDHRRWPDLQPVAR